MEVFFGVCVLFVVASFAGYALSALWHGLTRRSPNADEQIRMTALEMAVERAGSPDSVDTVTARARIFEKYLRDG